MHGKHNMKLICFAGPSHLLVSNILQSPPQVKLSAVISIRLAVSPGLLRRPRTHWHGLSHGLSSAWQAATGARGAQAHVHTVTNP